VEGEVTEIQDDDWVGVTWRGGNSNVYRWGADNMFDLEII